MTRGLGVRIVKRWAASYLPSFAVAVEMTLEKDAQAFTLSRVRDQAVGMVRTLIRLCETMKPVPEVS